MPVRSELLLATGEYGERIKRALARRAQAGRDRLRAARLPRAEALVERPRQRLDYAGAALPRSVLSLTERARSRLDRAGLALPSPMRLVQDARQKLTLASTSLTHGLGRAIEAKKLELSRAAGGLRPAPLRAETQRARKQLTQVDERARPALDKILEQRRARLEGHAKLLEALSYQSTLARGFAVVRGADGTVVRTARAAGKKPRLDIMFSDGELSAVPDGSAPVPKQKTPPAAKPKAPAKSSGPKSGSGDDQGSLF